MLLCIAFNSKSSRWRHRLRLEPARFSMTVLSNPLQVQTQSQVCHSSAIIIYAEISLKISVSVREVYTLSRGPRVLIREYSANFQSMHDWTWGFFLFPHEPPFKGLDIMSTPRSLWGLIPRSIEVRVYGSTSLFHHGFFLNLCSNMTRNETME